MIKVIARLREKRNRNWENGNGRKRERERQTTRMQTFNNAYILFLQGTRCSLPVYERIIIGRCGNIRANFFHPSRPLSFNAIKVFHDRFYGLTVPSQLLLTIYYSLNLKSFHPFPLNEHKKEKSQTRSTCIDVSPIHFPKGGTQHFWKSTQAENRRY